MKQILLFTLLSLFLFVGCQTKGPVAPVAKKIAHKLKEHGHVRIDNYYWMNQRDDSTVINYLKAENNYTKQMMAHTELLQEKLYNEMKARIKQDDQSVPYLKNGYYYYSRTIPEQEYSLVCRKAGTLESPEEVMLDLNAMAKGHEYFALATSSVSTNNQLLAYSIDTVSRRFYTIHFKDLKCGKILPDKISNTSGEIIWANDNKTVFYILKNPVTLRSEKIMRHVLGSNQTNDQLVYSEDDETFYPSLDKTKSGEYIFINSYSTLTTEARYINASRPNDSFKIVQSRTPGLKYEVEHYDNSFFINTNLDAPNYRVMKTPLDKTGKENWVEVIPHRSDVLIQGIELFKDYMVVSEEKEAINHLRIIPRKGEEYYIPFNEEVFLAMLATNKEYDNQNLRYTYTSLTTPSSTFEFNMQTKEQKLLKQQEVLGSFSSANYETKREYATASDGKKIPISLVYRKGLKKDGNNPTVLYGYGSYGYNDYPAFSSNRLSLLDRGFVYAIAHIRGSKTNGQQWYEDGKLLKKKNTFTDFIACSEYLIQQGYTSANKLFARGGSAGGLLVGAVVNMRPDLYKGIIAGVPFVDVVTTMLDESIPLTTGEFDEWGNPKNKEYYEYMLSYSPYDQVQEKNYPAMLVTTGLHDSQVQYWEPTKWVAKLRDKKTDKNPLILKINMDYGHGGASGRFKGLTDSALEYAFIFDQLGIKE